MDIIHRETDWGQTIICHDTNTERIMLKQLEMFFIDHLKLALLPMREVLLSWKLRMNHVIQKWGIYCAKHSVIHCIKHSVEEIMTFAPESKHIDLWTGYV